MDYCRKCKIKTKSIGAPTFILVKKRWRRLSSCRICNYNKNNVSKSPEAIETEELYKPRRKTYPTRHVIQKGIVDTLQIDIYEFYGSKGKETDPKYNFRHKRIEPKLSNFKILTRNNDGYNRILMGINIFTKYSWGIPLKTKSGAEQAAGLKNIIEDFIHIYGTAPRKIQCDMGKEFYNKDVKELLDSYGSELYSTGGDKKASIVERLNKTIGDKLKPIIHRGLSWVKALPNIFKTYNNTYHRTIKMKPVEVTKDNEAQLLSTVYNYRISTTVSKFEKGDRVRLSKLRDTFRNKLKPNWTEEIFEVEGVKRSNVVYYKLKDITDTVYEEELQLTKL